MPPECLYDRRGKGRYASVAVSVFSARGRVLHVAAAQPHSCAERACASACVDTWISGRYITMGPRLIPVHSHRYLLADPDRPGNPVLSIFGSDTIVFGRDIRRYLLNELRDLTRSPEEGPGEVDVSGIPFWGQVILNPG